MQDSRTRDSTARDDASALRKTRVAPSSSRMLTSYMMDIEQLLDEQQWEAALREALDLPQIAAALSDTQLTVNRERLRAWCDEWIRPSEPDRNARCAEYARVTEMVLARSDIGEGATVPSLALRRLRLRRLVRTPPRGFTAGRVAATIVPDGTVAVETCNILVETAHRWYAQSAVHDQAVQANLARLAVLR